MGIDYRDFIGIKPISCSVSKVQAQSWASVDMTFETEVVSTPRSINEKLQRITYRINKKRTDDQQDLARQGYSPEDVIAMQTEAPASKTQDVWRSNRGRAGTQIIERAQMSLFESERRGQFLKAPLHPSSEFPTMLARLPIFVPGRRTSQRRMIDKDNAIPFETSWGRGRKHGPPLTVQDEDTLLVLGRLRQDRLRGRGARMPIKVMDVMGQGDDLHVHVLYTTLSEIENFIGHQKSGQNFRARLNSIKRLASTRLEVDVMSDKAVERGSVISLLDVAWEKWESDSVLYIQFSPVMAHWFEKAFTYLDLNVRMSLTDTGKAIHRFLSSQPKSYAIGVEKLRSTIGYPRQAKYFLRDLRDSSRNFKNWVGCRNTRSKEQGAESRSS